MGATCHPLGSRSPYIYIYIRPRQRWRRHLRHKQFYSPQPIIFHHSPASPVSPPPLPPCTPPLERRVRDYHTSKYRKTKYRRTNYRKLRVQKKKLSSADEADASALTTSDWSEGVPKWQGWTIGSLARQKASKAPLILPNICAAFDF